MDVLIAGAGPGGIVAALALQKQGFSVRLVEKAREFLSLGGGLGIQSNGLRVLNALGLLEEMKPRLKLCQKAQIALWNGKTLSEIDLTRSGIPFPHFGVIQRYELHESLLQALAREGITPRMGLEVIGVDPGPGGSGQPVRVTLKDSQGHVSTEETSLLIGADGVHSPVRKSLVAKGCLLCREIRHQEPWLRLVAPFRAHFDGPKEIWGRDGRRVGLVPLPDGLDDQGKPTPRCYCFLPVGDRPWDQVLRTNLQEWKSTWKPYGPEVVDLLETVQDWDRVNVSTFHEVECSRWSDPPVFLLGDAAHGMTPNLGQGANCAMMDGLVLARLLATHKSDLNKTSAEYHRIRHGFVTTIQKTARTVGWLGGFQNAPARWLRDVAIRLSDRLPGVSTSSLRLMAGWNPLENDLVS